MKSKELCGVDALCSQSWSVSHNLKENYFLKNKITKWISSYRNHKKNKWTKNQQTISVIKIQA